MKTGNLLLAAFVGTTSMTLFSYLVSRKKNKNFKEPELLGKMLYRVIPGIKKPDSKVAGWCLHGATGLAFTIVYKVLLDHTKLKSNVPEAILLGVANGLAGVVIWKTTFLLHPNPPKINFRKFFGHLIVAHLFFATPALLILKDSTDEL